MSEGLLSGKRGIVTGVANERSIAWACAQACAKHGANLAFTYLGESQEKRVKGLLADAMPDAMCAPCDVQHDDQIEDFVSKAAEHLGGIDFVIHSVAYADRNDLSGRYVDTARENFSLALDISAYSLVALSRAVEAHLSENASIIAMTYYGAEKVIPKYNVMGVAKAALEASARYLAADLGAAGTRVNCISAGPIRTLSSAAFPGFRKMLRASEQVSPMRRNADQTDVADAVVYLASDLSRSVTGETLHVDCGYNILGMFDVESES